VVFGLKPNLNKYEKLASFQPMRDGTMIRQLQTALT
jgi:hypothetical protein